MPLGVTGIIDMCRLRIQLESGVYGTCEIVAGRSGCGAALAGDCPRILLHRQRRSGRSSRCAGTTRWRWCVPSALV